MALNKMDRFSLGQMMDHQLSKAVLGKNSLQKIRAASIASHGKKQKNSLDKELGLRRTHANLSKPVHTSMQKGKNKDEAWLSVQYPESINRIINHVHAQMHPQPYDIDAKIASIPAAICPPPSPPKTKKKNGRRSNKIFNNIAKSVMNLNSTWMSSIPQLKAAAQTKNLQNERRQSVLAAQERAREIVNQKRLLQDMLQEHQKLQRDRASIASEIELMKSYLGHIKKRLNTSLVNLNMKSKTGRK